MKIDNNDQILKSLYPQETAKSRPAGEKDFGTILKETVENAPKTDAAPRQTAFINPQAGVRLTTPGSPDPMFTVERIENMIDLLDQYRYKLADSRINLKQIDSIISKIARENDSLETLADSLPDDEIKNKDGTFNKEVSVDYTGTGCILYDMKIFNDMIPEKWFELTTGEQGQPVGEDINFCKKLGERKIPIVVDCSIDIKHLTLLAADWGTYKLFQKIMGGKQNGIGK